MGKPGNQYSIKDLERLSGIKAHTIRIWEQRYGIVNPERTSTNIRYYSDTDLRRILNIALLNQHKIKISRIAKMTDNEMSEEVIRLTASSESSMDSQIELLTLCMVEMDEDRFEKAMSNNILRHGFEKTMTSIIFPFLEKVGIMWMSGTIKPAQEHFISNAIRQKLIVAIDGQTNLSNKPEDTFLLFCPENEFHELGLLFMNYLLRSRKCKTIYLGAAVPFRDLQMVYEQHHPQYLFTYITILPKDISIGEYILQLANQFPQSTILLSGKVLDDIEIEWPDNTQHLPNVDMALKFIERTRHGSGSNNSN